MRGTAVLNVNYPARPVAEVAGITVARQAPMADMALAFKPDGDGRYRSERTDVAIDPAADTDLSLLGRGYVTVTPIGPGLSPGGPFEDLARRIEPRR